MAVVAEGFGFEAVAVPEIEQWAKRLYQRVATATVEDFSV